MLTLDVMTYLTTTGAANWRSTFIPLLQGLIDEQGEAWNNAYGMSFDTQNLYAAQWFDEYALQFSNYIMLTHETDLNKLLQQGMMEGWSVPTTQKHIEDLFNQWASGTANLDWWTERLPQYRLEMIARTETMRASNAGSYHLFRGWKASRKEWLGTPDDRIRPSHLEAYENYRQGGTPGPIPLDDYFIVDGKPMLYPGDAAGGAENCVNCRCSIVPLL